MNYRDTELRKALAAEYALGTLIGRARRRFHRLLLDDPALQSEVGAWEQRLHALAPPLPQIKPRPQVWVQIARAIGPPAGSEAKPAVAAPMPAVSAPTPPASAAIDIKADAKSANVGMTPPAANRSRFWQAWAGLATAAAIVLAIGLATHPAPRPPNVVAQQAPPSYVALLQMPNSTMHWTVSIAPKQGRLSLAANGEAPPLDGKSLELWWLSANGPVAIGVLPTKGTSAMPMPAAAADSSGPLKLAISVEPPGGSPTGQPTGPVVVVTEAVQSA